jgi:hypothetical protein
MPSRPEAADVNRSASNDAAYAGSGVQAGNPRERFMQQENEPLNPGDEDSADAPGVGGG